MKRLIQFFMVLCLVCNVALAQMHTNEAPVAAESAAPVVGNSQDEVNTTLAARKKREVASKKKGKKGKKAAKGKKNKKGAKKKQARKKAVKKKRIPSVDTLQRQEVQKEDAILDSVPLDSGSEPSLNDANIEQI